MGRDKTGYVRSEFNFVHCFISGENSLVSSEYNSVWSDGGETGNLFFMHHIHRDEAAFDKDIDTLDTLDPVYGNLDVRMEYGYGNPPFPECVLCSVPDHGQEVREDHPARQGMGQTRGKAVLTAE